MKKSNPVFNRINMREQGTLLLCEYMQNNKNKKYNEMKLPGCNLNDNDFCMIVKSLIENEIELPILNLSYNKRASVKNEIKKFYDEADELSMTLLMQQRKND